MTTTAVLALLFVGSLLVEALLLAFWVPSYYRRGLRLFRATVATGGRRVAPEELEERCLGGLVTAPLAFHEIAEGEIGFQEKASMRACLPYVPVIRGLITQRPGQEEAEVVGILLWYPLVAVVFAPLAVSAAGLWSAVAAAGAVAGVTILFGLLQWARFGELLTAMGPKHA